MADINLKASVEATLQRFAAHLVQPLNRVEFVRRQILVEVLKAFPKPHEWALLQKTERGDPPFYPSDVGWYLPSGEHYDVLTDKAVTGNPNVRRIAAAWVNNGIHERMRDGRWVPVKVADAVGIPPLPGATPEPEPEPEPEPPPSPGVDLQKEVAQIKADLITMALRFTAMSQRMEGLEARLVTLEHAPAPELPELEVVGTTYREWGHVHRVNLTVQRKPTP